MRQKIKNSTYASLFPWAALLAASALFALVFSRHFTWPAGMSHDSVLYLNGAKSLLAGKGYPYTHFPPLYPAALTFTSMASGKDLISSATLLLITLYGLNLFLAGTLMWRLKGSLLAGLGILSVFALLPGFARIHFEAMSEPLFFSCLLLSFIFLVEYLKTDRIMWAVLAGFAAGLAALTRYIGIFLVAVVALSVIIFDRSPIRKRIARAFISGAAGLAPATAWWIINLFTKGSMANRLLSYHPKSLEFFQFGWQSFSDLAGAQFITKWTLRLPGTVFVICFYLIIALIIYFIANNLRKGKHDPISIRFALICLVALVLYAMTLWFSVTFVDDSTTLTARIISPVFLLIIFGLWGLLWPSNLTQTNHPQRMLLALIVLLLLFVNLPGYLTVTKEFRKDGILFTGRAWSTSETLAWLDQLPDSIPIYSNENIPLGFFTEHPAYSLPERKNVSSGMPNPEFENNIAGMLDDAGNGKAILIIFTRNEYSELYPPKETLTASLAQCQIFADSEVYTGQGFFQEYCGEK
jgi:hypothetical protein